VCLQSAPIARAREALRHLLGESIVGYPAMMLPEGRRWGDTKDHAGGANPNLIAIVEGIGDARDETLALHEDTIGGLEIFNDEGGPTSQDTRVLATDTCLGQTEQILPIASKQRFVGKRHLRPTVESIEHF
jgi:hypothetical protein